jgi:dihydroxy-acid dehydratase
LGGPIAAIREGDIILFDIARQKLEAELDQTTLQHRMTQWKPPGPRYATGVFAKYAALVSSASAGAVTRART